MAYDIVLNGVEMGGGSMRINDPALQDRMFHALGFTEEKARESFGFLMDAYKFGAPPHGGMAYGLDRMVMLMLKKDSIRDVIAFPKVQNAGEPQGEACLAPTAHKDKNLPNRISRGWAGFVFSVSISASARRPASPGTRRAGVSARAWAAFPSWTAFSRPYAG